MEVNKHAIADWLKGLQQRIVDALEGADGKEKFSNEPWTRPEGGGGISRVIRNGAVIEKGGVMFSAVEGEAPEFLFREREHSTAASSGTRPTFFATGVSIVIHPVNPHVPIIHMNVRYFEMSNGQRWLGGGIDLTPHYIVADDARFFHRTLKDVCDRHHKDYYQKFRQWADDYFYITHRQETRGIGGIFFDRLQATNDMDFNANLDFWKDVGDAFAPVYTELIRRNAGNPFTDHEQQWQLLRRGRYVEFNLIYDKGTKFGLETNGRVESILMSLPRTAGWEYNYLPKENSKEAQTLSLLKKGMDWITS